MSSAGATVIDFAAYRERKLKREREVAAVPIGAPSFPAGPIAWMPVFLVPVFYMVGGLSAGAAYG